MYCKNITFLIEFFFQIGNILCCSCCLKNDKLKYIDRTNEFYNTYLSKIRNQNCKKNDLERLKNILKDIKNVISTEESNSTDTNFEGFKLRYIDYESISELYGLCSINIAELKKQTRFISLLSSIYLLEFILRLVAKEGEGKVNFMLTINGVGGPVLHSAGFVNLMVGDCLCKNKCSTEIDSKNLKSKTLDKGAKGIFTSIPIFDVKNHRIYSNTASSLAFFNGGYFKTGDRNKDISLINFYILCEYLAQLGNPLFAICDGSEFCVASIYNALQDLSSFLDIPFYNSIGSNTLDIFNQKRSGETVQLENDEIFEKIKPLGAVGEIDMIMLAEVIALNNLLYYVYKFAKNYKKEVISNLVFSSYGGRVFEMLMSLIKDEYRMFSGVISEKKVVSVKKNSLTAVLIHGLIGDNRIKKNEKEKLFFNNENLFKAFAGGIVSQDRLKYFSCDNIFGNSFDSIFEFYNEKVNSEKINQIISKFRRKSNYNLLKNLVRWDIDEAIYSFYDGEFNDGLLSSDGLFIYNKFLDRNYVNDIIGTKVDNKSSKTIFYSKYPSNTQSKLSVVSQSGCYIIEDKNIRYIHMGGGTHMCVDNEKDSYDIYENRGEFLKKLIEILYDVN